MLSKEELKRRRYVGGAIVALCAACALWYVGTLDSHRTNFRYLIWKAGLAPHDYQRCLHLTFVDLSFRNSMRGKTVAELRNWIPDMAPASPGSLLSESIRAMSTERDVTFLVVGRLDVAVRLREGKFEDLLLMKG